MSVTTTSGWCFSASVERFGAVARLADDLEVAARSRAARQRAEDHRLILGDEDADHDATIARREAGRRGTTSVRRVPRRRRARRVPPISASRARIPESPAPSAAVAADAVVLDRQA